ncbi:MAG: HEAT repeat domain-containing protein, partial [Desulfobacteraceae bacterium]|nr:HEAT repeat domain-containing protein [Desulfobacteraceae bacterium]
ESGGIGWGSVEAMGEILKLNKTLAKEYESILFSYINPEGNFLEHEMLQQGSLWGVGTYLETCNCPNKSVIKTLLPFLDSNDPVKRGYAARALINMDKKNISLLPDHILSDKNEIPIFDDWNLSTIKVSAIAKKQ